MRHTRSHGARPRIVAWALVACRLAAVGLTIASPSRAEPAPSEERPARITLGPGGVDVRLSGDLLDGTAERLSALLAAHPDVARIHLTSEGGLVDEGLALGELIAARGLSTYVPDYCVSACTLAFVRGRERYLRNQGRLGFHAPYETDADGRIVQLDAAPERGAYVAAGTDPDFVARALAVASEDIWIPEAGDLIRARVVTQVVDAHRFPDSTLDDDDTEPAVRAVLLRNLPILADLDADDLDGLAAWYRDGYRAGRSEGEALAGLRRRTAAMALRRFRDADDATIRDLGGLLARAVREAAARKSASCGAIAAGDLLLATESLEASALPVSGLHGLIAGRRGHGVPTVPEAPARAGPVAGDVGLACDGPVAAYGAALERPADEAASMLRALLFREAPRRTADASALP